ncbi:MAG: SPOR domain-containing protein [Candidatus Cloacimonetes bacterium]|nr:SPOR domain-containing protein [Candidatus Cloacimonadota bacterium]
MSNKIIQITAICLLLFACAKEQKQPAFPQPTTTMQSVSKEIDFKPEKLEIIDTTNPEEAEIPRFLLNNQPITETPKEVANIPVTPPPPAKTTPSAPLQTGEFTAQFLSAKQRGPVEALSKKLTAANYATEVQEATVNGETIYRLRLSGSYSKDSAEQLAKEIKGKFSSDISSYWVTRR